MPLAFPAVKQPPTTREPRNMLLYGRTKVGKSTIASMLPSALHADLEGGTELISTRRVEISSVPPSRSAWRAEGSIEAMMDLPTFVRP